MQGMRAIDTMIIVPSEDVRNIAHRHHQELPMALRALLRGIGGKRPRENRLISYLLFEQNFTREMIDLGYRDAMNVKTELLDFVSGADVPRLFAPSWVKQDLSEAT
jgi:NTE family protein